MNCVACAVDTRENPGICKDILNLFNILGIPMQERAILWNMALENIRCVTFSNVLPALIEKTRSVNG